MAVPAVGMEDGVGGNGRVLNLEYIFMKGTNVRGETV